MEKISVIIVHWNVPESLNQCLNSIWATKYSNLEIIVIDNASNQPLHLNKVKLIRNKENVGFPKAVNQGLEIATGDYVLILNPDTKIEKEFFIKAIKFAKDHPNMGVMGPKFLNPDSTVQGSVFPEPSIFHPTSKYTPSETCEVFTVSGGCMFIPKKIIEKIGYLTEEVFMYYEDMDYCRRLHKAGFQVFFNSDTTIIHEHGNSAKQSARSNPEMIPFWKGHLWDSSLWYNGPIKHYLMSIISWVNQKLQKYFPIRFN